MPHLSDANRGKPCILVVDDDQAVIDAIALRLGRDFRVLGTTDPRQAVARALRERPDLILCDIGMPGMQGDEVAHALSVEDGTMRIPLIYLTGLVEPHRPAQLDGLFGDHRAIAKGAPTAQLRELILEVLGILGGR